MRMRLKRERLLDILAASNLSQNHWAIKLGLSRGHWSEIVNGKHPYVSAKTRARMLEVFQADARDLFEVESGPASWADTDFRSAISDRYLVDTEIGQGGMGAVYLARDARHGRLVALKVIAAEAVSELGLAQFQREISTIAHLTHPNILALLDSGEAAGQPYYAMPYLRGGSLRQRLNQKGRLTLAEALPIIKGIAAGLSHAHGERVLHCDVKPENVLLHEEHAWVTDFGIARKLHGEVREWATPSELDLSAGTPAYVSPEQAAGEADIDGRSDTYSLGCMVYEMLSGHTPFEGTSTQAIVARRFIVPPPPLCDHAPELPAALQFVVERSMAVAREQRPASPALFAAELEQALTTPRRLASLAMNASRAVRRLRARPNRPASTPRSDLFVRLHLSLEGLTQDIGYAARQIRRHPGFAALEIATFALAIGLTTAIFTAVNGALLRPLPYHDPGRLVLLQGQDSVRDTVPVVSADNWNDWRTSGHTFDDIAIYQERRVPMFAEGEAVRVNGALVSPNLPGVLGQRLVTGRGFTANQEQVGVAEVMIGEGLWRRALGARWSDTLSLTVEGNTAHVVGVVADGQEFPAGAELWTAFRYRHVGGAARNNINWTAVGRLKRGVTRQQAEADLDLVSRQIRATDPQALYAWGVPVTPLRDALLGSASTYLVLLFGAVALVLLIACSNLASANLARAVGREREMAVRAAIGGGRSRLARLLLIERMMAALAGGAVGLGLATALVAVLRTSAATQLPRVEAMQVDGRVALFALLVSAAAGLITGALPARHGARTKLSGVLNAGGRSARGWRRTPGRLLVAAEVALAVTLVAGAGLLVQSFRAVLGRSLGFDTRGVVVADISLAGPAYQREPARTRAFWNALLDRLRGDGAIASAGLANWIPLGGGGASFIEIAGRSLPNAGASYRVIGEGYLEALNVPLLQGRMIAGGDDSGATRVALINRAMAEEYFAGEDPIGRQLRAPSMEAWAGGEVRWATIVGVVGNVRHYGHESEERSEMYVAWRQTPMWISSLNLVARSRGSTAALERSMQAAIHALDPGVAVDIEPMDQRARRNVAERRFTMQVLGVFGVLALGLVVVGVYGVLSLSVAQRTRELAVRAALGADRPSLLRLVLRDAGNVVVIGTVIGLGVSLLATRLLSSLLLGVSPHNPVVLGGAIAVILVAGFAAAFVPAMRATKADPAVALQSD